MLPIGRLDDEDDWSIGTTSNNVVLARTRATRRTSESEVLCLLFLTISDRINHLGPRSSCWLETLKTRLISLVRKTNRIMLVFMGLVFNVFMCLVVQPSLEHGFVITVTLLVVGRERPLLV